MSRSSKSQVARAGFFVGVAGTGIAAAATAAAWHWLARRPLPKVRGTIELKGLAGRVQVRRDRWGVGRQIATNAFLAWLRQHPTER